MIWAKYYPKDPPRPPVGWRARLWIALTDGRVIPFDTFHGPDEEILYWAFADDWEPA